MKGRILVINPGSTSTKIGFYDAGEQLFEKNLTHSVEELSVFKSVMDQTDMRREKILELLAEKGIDIETIDIVMARGGIITPIKSGVYAVTQEMRDALKAGKAGIHASNLAALIADDIASMVNDARAPKGVEGKVSAYIADAPMSDDMLPEVKVSGVPEFPRRAAFHALNSRAMVRKYAQSVGKSVKELTVIVAHMGGGTSVSLHRNGLVIDTNDALGGEGPISPERAGTVPGFPLVEMCFSGKYTKEEVKKKLIGKGGSAGWFGTNDFRDVENRAVAGEAEYVTFLKGFNISVAKYIGGLATVVGGKVDAIIITGGIAYGKPIVNDIRERVEFIAPVVVYPGENELESLAENGYGVLAGEFDVKYYHADNN